jgi:plastocyanin
MLSEKSLTLGLVLVVIAGITLATATSNHTTSHNNELQAREQNDSVYKVSIVPDATYLGNESYQPNPIEVKIGDTVMWTNDDSALHTVTSGSPVEEEEEEQENAEVEFDSGFMATGKTFEQKFTAEGQFSYFCTLHPDMVGQVTVS